MVVYRVDNILVSGKSDSEHFHNPSEVLKRLESAVTFMFGGQNSIRIFEQWFRSAKYGS